MAALAFPQATDRNVGQRLEWIRLTGLFRRQVDLLQKLMTLLLRQREAIVLVDLALFQKVALDQIQLLHELEHVQQATEEQARLLALGAEIPGQGPRISELVSLAPPERRSELDGLRQELAELAREVLALAQRNEKLLTALGEIRGAEYEALLKALTSLGRTYGEMRAAASPTSLCDVVA